MTLVVSGHAAGEIFILADTRITDPSRGSAGRPPTHEGALKTLILLPHVCLSFANSPDNAHKAVKAFRAKGNLGLGQSRIIEHFRADSETSGVDYLLGFAGPKTIFKIEGGEAKPRQTAYIGDHAGFELYQANPVRPQPATAANSWGPDPPGHGKMADVIERFEKVVDDFEVSSVGGPFSIVVSGEGKFRFLEYWKILFDMQPIRGEDGVLSLPSTGENREFRFVTLAPVERGVTALCFYHPGGAVGYFFGSTDGNFALSCIVFRGAVDDVVSAINAQAGVELGVVEVGHT